MCPQLKAYYLQQMGIKRWVRRSLDAPELFFHIVSPAQTQPEMMIVLENCAFDTTHHWLLGNVGQLLKNMLHGIGLSNDNVALLCGSCSIMNAQVLQRDALLKEQVVKLKPKLILILGPFLTHYLHSEDNPIPVMSSDHPVDLFNNPIQKKRAFVDWMRVKHLICP